MSKNQAIMILLGVLFAPAVALRLNGHAAAEVGLSEKKAFVSMSMDPIVEGLDVPSGDLHGCAGQTCNDNEICSYCYPKNHNDGTVEEVRCHRDGQCVRMCDPEAGPQDFDCVRDVDGQKKFIIGEYQMGCAHSFEQEFAVVDALQSGGDSLNVKVSGLTQLSNGPEVTATGCREWERCVSVPERVTPTADGGCAVQFGTGEHTSTYTVRNNEFRLVYATSEDIDKPVEAGIAKVSINVDDDGRHCSLDADGLRYTLGTGKVTSGTRYDVRNFDGPHDLVENYAAAFTDGIQPPGMCVPKEDGPEHEDEHDHAGANGDPHVVTIFGAKFNILQLGTVSLLKVAETGLGLVSLAVHAAVDRVKSATAVQHHCSATYIQNVSMTGQWLGDQNAQLEVRVVHWVPKAEALEVRFGQDSEWRPIQHAKEKLDTVTAANAGQLNIVLHGVTLNMRLGLNRRGQDQGYNFLNLNVRGLGNLGRDVRLSGLLAGDDYSEIAKSPSDCKRAPASMTFAKGKSNQDYEEGIYDDAENFLSYLSADTA